MEIRVPAVAYGKEKISIEEYLEMENAAVEKHEYYKGGIFVMSGAKMPHNISKSFQPQILYIYYYGNKRTCGRLQ